MQGNCPSEPWLLLELPLLLHLREGVQHVVHLPDLALHQQQRGTSGQLLPGWTCLAHIKVQAATIMACTHPPWCLHIPAQSA